MNRIPSNVLEFAGDKRDIYELFTDYYCHHVNQFHKGKFSVLETKTLNEKEELINKAYFSEIERMSRVPFDEVFATKENLDKYCGHPSVKWAAFAVISAMVDAVLPLTLIDSIGLYTDQRTIGWGDSAAFDVKPRDLFVVSKHGRQRRRAEIQRQFVSQVTILPELREVTVGVPLYRVLAGLESLAEYVYKVVRSVETEITLDVYNAMHTAMENLPTTPANQALRVVGYSQDTLVELAQKVEAFNFGAKPIIVGTKRAINKILPDNANYRYTLTGEGSEYTQIGYIRQISGYDIFELPQVANWQNPYETALDDSKIWIISPSSQKIVKLVYEGSTLSNTDGTFDNANLYQTSTLFKSWGVGIATNAIAAEIELV